jgi:orotidine-5'-phosphate decarboxylase
MAKQHPDVVAGFISMGSTNLKVAHDRKLQGMLHVCPGVRLPPEPSSTSASVALLADESKQDQLGQCYKTPLQAIRDDGADVIVVGRGIYDAPDILHEAKRYQQAGWSAYKERLAAKT